MGTIQLICGCEVLLLSRGTCVALHLCVRVRAHAHDALFTGCVSVPMYL